MSFEEDDERRSAELNVILASGVEALSAGRRGPEVLAESLCAAYNAGWQRSLAELAKLAKLQEELEAHDHTLALQWKRERPWVDEWRDETGRHDTLPDYGDMLSWLADKIIALRQENEQLRGVVQREEI
jgi:hypothetical protein